MAYELPDGAAEAIAIDVLSRDAQNIANTIREVIERGDATTASMMDLPNDFATLDHINAVLKYFGAPTVELRGE